MANKFYPKGAEKVLSGAVNFSTANISVALVANAYTYSDAHEYLSDLGATVGTAQPLASKVTTGGVFDADDVAFSAVAPGSTVKALAIFRDKVLSIGHSRDLATAYREFRGKDPSVEPLLEHRGLK